MDRQLLGFLILAALALAAVGFTAFKMYHGRDRTHARRQRKEWARDARDDERGAK